MTHTSPTSGSPLLEARQVVTRLSLNSTKQRPKLDWDNDYRADVSIEVLVWEPNQSIRHHPTLVHLKLLEVEQYVATLQGDVCQRPLINPMEDFRWSWNPQWPLIRPWSDFVWI